MEKYEVRYREAGSEWFPWIRSYDRNYCEGAFERLRGQANVTEARLMQANLILDSFSRVPVRQAA